MVISEKDSASSYSAKSSSSKISLKSIKKALSRTSKKKDSFGEEGVEATASMAHVNDPVNGEVRENPNTNEWEHPVAPFTELATNGAANVTGVEEMEDNASTKSLKSKSGRSTEEVILDVPPTILEENSRDDVEKELAENSAPVATEETIPKEAASWATQDTFLEDVATSEATTTTPVGFFSRFFCGAV
eukprot:CAMPEP_0172423776 /NCGR_PEP_ID=MMETSP1064-20121228/17728_1 /TAXON_ID=202472 /ORGANISM="Aulacoseira subarctica , Strain CCAP 1002/5" /LENGTH=188 /DNA_ID=CAMNT_0013165309 /DNA_START=80 /DNA_END=646 /DNA_ORIENTATION=+